MSYILFPAINWLPSGYLPYAIFVVGESLIGHVRQAHVMRDSVWSRWYRSRTSAS